MALWESLSTVEREAELELNAEQAAELDRRWAEHVENPGSAIPWDEVRRKLLDRRVKRGVSFRPEAEAETLETRDWYEGRRPGLGAEFRAALDETIERIADNPMQFRLV